MKMTFNEDSRVKIPAILHLIRLGYEYLSLKDVNWDIETNIFPRFILGKNKTKLLSPFDLVIEISGGSPTQSTGRMAYLTQETFERFDLPLICSNFCKAISLFDNKYFYNFVYQWKAIYENGILFGWEGKTSGIKNLLFDAFVNKYHVCLPPELLAKSFYDFVEPLNKKKNKLLKENSELISLRDWLLPMLMNGLVTVK